MGNLSVIILPWYIIIDWSLKTKFFRRPLKSFLLMKKREVFFFFFLLYPMRSMGESIGIGLAASSNSKGPQVKTTDPMVSIKVTNCSIQLGWILACNCFAKNYMGSRPEAKKCHFSFSACGWICGWMDGCYHFFGPRFFPHR